MRTVYENNEDLINAFLDHNKSYGRTRFLIKNKNKTNIPYLHFENDTIYARGIKVGKFIQDGSCLLIGPMISGYRYYRSYLRRETAIRKISFIDVYDIEDSKKHIKEKKYYIRKFISIAAKDHNFAIKLSIDHTKTHILQLLSYLEKMNLRKDKQVSYWEKNINQLLAEQYNIFIS